MGLPQCEKQCSVLNYTSYSTQNPRGILHFNILFFFFNRLIRGVTYEEFVFYQELESRV